MEGRRKTLQKGTSEADQARDAMKRQRERWMRDREISQQMTEVSNEMGNINQQQRQEEQYLLKEVDQADRMDNQRNQGGYGNQPEVMERMFAKMSEKLETKFQNKPELAFMKQNYAKASGQQLNDKGEVEAEQSLYNQVVSHTCPICFEMLLPPDNSPFILFPCGHTFCRTCIERYAKVKKCCPFCRAKFNSMAPNISLQNLIKSACEKKEGYEESLEKRKVELDDPRNKYEREQTENEEQFVRDLQMICVKAKVLQDERQETQVMIDTGADKVKVKEKSVNMILEEKRDCLDRLRKVQKELELITQFEQAEDQELQKLRKEHDESKNQLGFIEEALRPVEQQKQKLVALVQATAPGKLKDIEDLI